MSSTDGLRATKARIRDAAIRRFAIDGLDASLRSIAADAQVSAPLILHHFGSRAGLRQECDAHVVELSRASKSSVLDPFIGPAAFIKQVAEAGSYAVIVGYVLRLLQAGGAATQEFVERSAASMQEYLAHAESLGTVRPSRDPAARARLLAEQSLGALLLRLPARQERLDLESLPSWIEGYARRVAVASLELLTEGLLTDSALLEAYLAAAGEPDTAPGQPAPGTEEAP